MIKNYFLFIIIFIVATIGCKDIPSNEFEHIIGTIESPSNADSVGITFECIGQIKGMKPEFHAWLVVEEGAGEPYQYWPKGKELYIEPDGKWSTQIYEDGAGREFALSLFVVGEIGHQTILNWLANGSKTGSYPPLHEIPNSQRLSSIPELFLRK